MTLLLVQIAAVLLTALLCGAVAQRFGQAKVIGEIAGGILLGPSVFGKVAPHASAVLFPQSSLGAFDILSTLGLVLFLFLIGVELDLDHLRDQKLTATLASASSIVLPMALAAVATPWLYRQCAPTGTPILPFGMFLGISISITALPVLARILEEKQMQGTSLGAMALLCAAVDDVAAWSLLAFALTLLPSHGGQPNVWKRILGLGLYLIVMVGLLRPLGRWIGRRYPDLPFSYEVLGLSVGFVLLSSASTDALGAHPLFGAFIAGLCFPRIPTWQKKLRMRFDPLVSVLLLPLFFALTGMRTRLDLLGDSSAWLLGFVVLTIAIAGKIGGAVAGARLTGQSWYDAFALGALLNTRGLVELIVLNVAYNAHVFSPVLFALLVTMALVTTAMTTPLLDYLTARQRNEVARDLPSTVA